MVKVGISRMEVIREYSCLECLIFNIKAVKDKNLFCTYSIRSWAYAKNECEINIPNSIMKRIKWGLLTSTNRRFSCTLLQINSEENKNENGMWIFLFYKFILRFYTDIFSNFYNTLFNPHLALKVPFCKIASQTAVTIQPIQVFWNKKVYN